MEKQTRQTSLLTLILLLAGMLFIISAGIALPILCRPFYYEQIGPLGLEEVRVSLPDGRRTLTRAEIKEAYDEVLDYCIGASETFGTGVLAYSEEGKAHFTDCRALFLLDFKVLAASAAVLILCFILRRFTALRAKKWGGRGAGFWCGVSVLALFAVIGAAAAADFERFFEVFHHVFFPGKSNWLFDPDVDQVINILPERLFMNFGIAIAGLIMAACVVLIAADCVRRKREKRADA